MKHLLNFTFILFTFSAYTIESQLSYTVKSDEKSDSVKSGKCIVYGKAIDAYNTAISNALISTTDHNTKTYSDENGNFKLTINETDSSIFLFKSGYKEIIVKSYDFKSQHKVEINFFLQQDIEMIMVRKPVIYLYNAPQQNISIQLKPKSKLTFTYPKYNNGWNITATPEGVISDGKRTYPYLFWEGEQQELTFNKNETGSVDGFFIKTDSTVSFLENKLAYLGLNNKEATDFITFWVPGLEQKEYAYIQFFVDDVYDNNIGDLIVNPKPNSTRRIYMVYNSTQNSTPLIDIKEQDLPKFKREGFTVIEWGGSEVNLLFEL